MQVCDTKPKPHTVCEDGPMVEKRGGTYSKWEAVKMNNTFFFLAAMAKHPCSKKGSLANESISERQRRRRLIRFELCWRAGDIPPANSAVPIRKARGSRVCFSGSSFHIHLVAALSTFADRGVSFLSYNIAIISLTERSLQRICCRVIFYSATRFSCLRLRESLVEKKIWFRLNYLCK